MNVFTTPFCTKIEQHSSRIDAVGRVPKKFSASLMRLLKGYFNQPLEPSEVTALNKLHVRVIEHERNTLAQVIRDYIRKDQNKWRDQMPGDVRKQIILYLHPSKTKVEELRLLFQYSDVMTWFNFHGGDLDKFNFNYIENEFFQELMQTQGSRCNCFLTSIYTDHLLAYTPNLVGLKIDLDSLEKYENFINFKITSLFSLTISLHFNHHHDFIISKMKQNPQFTNLRALTLHSNDSSSVAHLLRSPFFTNLQNIDFYQEFLFDHGSVHPYTNLTSLVVNHIDDTFVKQATKLVSLRHLEVRWSRVENVRWKVLMETNNWTNLESLDTDLYNHGFKYLLESQCFPKLRHLKCKGTQLDQMPEVEVSPCLKQLETLILPSCETTEESFSRILPIFTPNLKHLDLRGHKLDKGFRHLSCIAPTLRFLHIKGTPQEFHHIKNCGPWLQLVHLKLSTYDPSVTITMIDQTTFPVLDCLELQTNETRPSRLAKRLPTLRRYHNGRQIWQLWPKHYERNPEQISP